MTTIIIDVKSTLQSSYCIDAADGEKLYKQLKIALVDGNVIHLSFEGIELLIAAFLNVAIGKLFADFDNEYLQNHLVSKNIHPDFQHLWDKVIQRTPVYYCNKESMDHCISNIIEE